jgi:membrane-bound lytic murein transglycosylase MltF
MAPQILYGLSCLIAVPLLFLLFHVLTRNNDRPQVTLASQEKPAMERADLAAPIVQEPEQAPQPASLPSPRKTTVAPESVNAPVSTPPMPSAFASSRVFQKWTGDLDGMAKRRLIRVLVVYSKTMYYLDGAQERGLSYDAIKEFEDFVNAKYKTGILRISVVPIPVSRDELLPGLIEGRGDISAANLTITPEREESVDFSNPFFSKVTEWLVTGPGAPHISTIDDLSGVEVFVRKSSSYCESLEKLNEQFETQGKPPVRIVPVSEYLESEDILEMTNAGIYPVTVIDSHLGEFWIQVFPHIKLHRNLPLRKEGMIGWAFRKDSPKLRTAINDYVRTHKMGTTAGNLLFQKYLKSANWIKNNVSTQERKKFVSTVNIFRKYAGNYGFDYLLVTAQGYQESKLDQSVVSRSGAVGIMQVLPSTAKDPKINIANIRTVENNVHAGTKYMWLMMNNYFKDDPMDDLNRNLFAFASYNAGPGRIDGLRKEAARMGLNPNVWFRNVEVVAAREIGRETVQYVSNIYKYYLAYKQIQASQQMRQQAKKTASLKART